LDSSDLESVPVLDDPFELLAFLHLQSSRYGSRADEIVLAVLTTPLNHLQFGKESHGHKLALSLVTSNDIFSHLLRGIEQESSVLTRFHTLLVLNVLYEIKGYGW
jgi:hypothetical protein